MNIKDLAKKIALAALAAIYGNPENVNAETPVVNLLDSETDDGRKIFAEKINLILKKPDVDYNRYLDNPDSHRSHRSHSSHRSHYSGHNSGHLSHYSHYSSSTGNSNSSNSNSNNSTPSYSPPKTYTPTTYSLGDRIIKYGSVGDDVIQLKTKLKSKGYLNYYSGISSSTYDSNTRSAVKKFQADYSLEEDGIAGQMTVFYLSYDIEKPSTSSSNNVYSNSSNDVSSSFLSSYELGDRTLKYGMNGDDVKELKELLFSHDLYPEAYTKNSYFDSDTKVAIKKFQSSRGLTADGIVGKKTIKELNIEPVDVEPVYSSPPIKTYDSKEGETYKITKKTSLRKGGESKASVIERLSIGEKVIILNSVENTYWWKVKALDSGNVGWVKKQLLKK